MCTRSWHLPPVRAYELALLDAALDRSVIICLPRQSMHIPFSMLLVKNVCSVDEGTETQCVIVVQSDDDVQQYMEALSVITAFSHEHVANAPSAESTLPPAKVLVMNILTLRLCLDNRQISLSTLRHLIVPQCEHLTANGDWSYVSLQLEHTLHHVPKVFCTTNLLATWHVAQPAEKIQEIAIELEDKFRCSLYFWQEHDEVDVLPRESVGSYCGHCIDLAPGLAGEYAACEETTQRLEPETLDSGQSTVKLILAELISFLSLAGEGGHLVAMARDGASACLLAWNVYGAVACESLAGHVVTSLREYVEANYDATDAAVPSSQAVCLAELAQSRLRAVAELCTHQAPPQSTAGCDHGKLRAILELLKTHGFEQSSVDVYGTFCEPTADRFVKLVEHGDKRRCVVVLPADARWEAIALSAALNSALYSGDSRRAAEEATFSVHRGTRASCYLAHASPTVDSTDECSRQVQEGDTTARANPSPVVVRKPADGPSVSAATSDSELTRASEVTCNRRSRCTPPLRDRTPPLQDSVHSHTSPRSDWLNCFLSLGAIGKFASPRSHLDVLVTTVDSVGYYMPACSLAIVLDHHRMPLDCSSLGKVSVGHLSPPSSLLRRNDAYTLQQDLCVRSMASTAAARCVSLVPDERVQAVEAFLSQRKDVMRMLRRRSARESVLDEQDLDKPQVFAKKVLASAKEPAASIAKRRETSDIESATHETDVGHVNGHQPERTSHLLSSRRLTHGCYQASVFRSMVSRLTETGVYVTHGNGDHDGVGDDRNCLTGCAAVAVLNSYAKRIASSDFRVTFSHAPSKTSRDDHPEGVLHSNGLDNEELLVIASIQIPRVGHSLEARMPITGEACGTRYDAFQSAALRTCAMLHLTGELRDDFRTNVNFKRTMLDGSPSVLAEYRKREGDVECLSRVETYDVMNAEVLSKCLPRSNEPLHFYLVDYRMNDALVSRMCACFTDPFWDKADVFLAIVSRERLIEIRNIEVYPRIGPSLADVVRCESSQSLNPSQLELLKRFHTCLFTKLISLDLGQYIADFDAADRTYLIAPVRVAQALSCDGSTMPKVSVDYQVVDDVLLYAACIHTDPTCASDPTSDAAGDPASDPTSDVASDSTSNPTSDPTSDPASDPASDPTSDPASDPASDPTSDPASDSASDPTSDVASDPASDPTSDAASDPASDAASGTAIPEVSVNTDTDNSATGHTISRSGSEAHACQLGRVPELSSDKLVVSTGGSDVLPPTPPACASDNTDAGAAQPLPRHDHRSWSYEELKGVHVRSKHGDQALYLVMDIMYDESPLTEFQRPRGDRYTFADYYSSRYGLEIEDLSQPLLRVVLAGGKPDSKGPKGHYYFHDESCARVPMHSRVVKLVPELCYVVPLGAVTYRALICLTTVLEKLEFATQVRHLRQQIASDVGFCLHDSWDTVDMSTFYDGGERLEDTVGNARRSFCDRLPTPGGCDLHGTSYAKKMPVIGLGRHTIDDVRGGPQCCSRPRCPPIAAIMNTLTMRPEISASNMKRFELLGDVYIKQKCSQLLAATVGPARDVCLTTCRSELVCNFHLYQCGCKVNLPEYMRCSHEKSTKFVPPCFVRRQQQSTGSSPARQLRVGGIANATEALIGVFYFYTAEGAAGLCRWLGLFATLPDLRSIDLYQYHRMSCPSTAHDVLSQDINGRSPGELNAGHCSGRTDVSVRFGNNSADALLHPPCPPSPQERSAGFIPLSGLSKVGTAASPDHLVAVQKQLGYVFNDASWLTEALSHHSSREQSSTGSYQFMEWIGDSFLDLLVIRKMYSDGRLSGWREGQLTVSRSQLVCNTTIAKLSLSCHLQKYLRVGSAETLAGILDYSRWWQSAKAQCQFQHQELSMADDDQILKSGFPKELADIWEAVLGAVYMDSGLDLGVVWHVLEPLIMPLYETCTDRMPSTELERVYEAAGGQSNVGYSISNILPTGQYICTVKHIGVRRFVGVGLSPLQAQRRAVRLALSSINN